jgi:hypothetical protein
MGGPQAEGDGTSDYTGLSQSVAEGTQETATSSRLSWGPVTVTPAKSVRAHQENPSPAGLLDQLLGQLHIQARLRRAVLRDGLTRRVDLGQR